MAKAQDLRVEMRVSLNTKDTILKESSYHSYVHIDENGLQKIYKYHGDCTQLLHDLVQKFPLVNLWDVLLN